jgi:uncharacterized protein (DUF983 family)
VTFLDIVRRWYTRLETWAAAERRSLDATTGGRTIDPYGGLDPGSRGDVPLLAEAGSATVFARGLRKRCPRCGERRIWQTWFRAKTLCPRCGLRFEQEEGGWLGAMTVNYAFACIVWLVALALALAATVPDVPVAPVLVLSIAILGGLPLWFYPRSKMLWAAVEFLTARSEPGYRTPTARDPRAGSVE